MTMEQNAQPIRVAQMMTDMNYGGVEMVVMNYYRHMDRSRVQFDFFALKGSTLPQREEIERLGGRVYVVPKYTHLPQYEREIGRLFRISGGTLTFRVDDESQSFRLYEAEDGGLSITSADGSVLYLACNKKDASVTVYQIRADVTAIGDYAFDALTALTRLEYAGRIEAFRQIVKTSAPYFLSGLAERGITTVVCADGSYDISAES